MEWDDLIIFVLLFAFWVVPALLKRLKGMPRKNEPARQEKKKPALLGKLGTAIQEFVRELEKQAQEAKKEAGTTSRESGGNTYWDLLDDRGQAPEEPPAAQAAARETHPGSMEVRPDPAPGFYDPERPFAAPEKKSPPGEGKRRRRESPGCEKRGEPVGHAPEPVPAGRVVAFLPAHALQQAVVWSEILGPPKARRRDY